MFYHSIPQSNRSGRPKWQASHTARRLLIWLFGVIPFYTFTSGLGAVRLRPLVPTETIHFKLLANYGIVVPVRVNGVGPFNFLLDTGSTITMVDSSVATKAAITSAEAGAVASLARKIPVRIATAASVTFGPVERTGLELLVRDLGGLQAADRSIVGVLGQNALEDTDYLLDYPKRLIHFDISGAIARAIGGKRHVIISVPLAGETGFSNPALCAGVDQASSCENLLLLDSGTASLVLFRTAKLYGLPTRVGYIRDTTGADRSTEIYTVDLCLEDLCRTLEGEKIDFRDDNTKVIGLLPTSFFRRLFVSNKGRFIIPEPRLVSPHGRA